MTIKEISIELEGFGDIRKKLHQDEQPEVLDPKTGKPLNLKDPDFPVVTGHKFRYRYWAMAKDTRSLIAYLEEHYDYFNKTRFHGKLKRPNIAILKDVAAHRMRLRGVWKPGLRTLAFSPNLFNAPHEGWVNRILIHEMCHQEVTDFDGGEREEQGHGPKWKAAMVRAGLPPIRYDYESNETYMDKVEKQKHAKLIEKRNAVKQAHKILTEERVPVTKVAVGMNVLFTDPHGEIVYGKVQAKEGGKWLVYVESKGKHYYVAKLAMFQPQS
jgi:predicted SprT family Zn-dependent metalloprotease